MPPPAQPFKLPKGTLTRINLAHSFAEYDPILPKQGVFVETPAAKAATDATLGKCLFIGRRGSGKTAITWHVSTVQKNAIQLIPKCLTSIGQKINVADYMDTRQRPFYSLVHTFKIALMLEAVASWIKVGAVSKHHLPDAISREAYLIHDHDFDSRVLEIHEEVLPALKKGNDKAWFKANRKLKELLKEVTDLASGDRWKLPILIDKVDEDWDGTDESVVVLMGLMHAAVELNAHVKNVRPLLFLRENLFERVRRVDNEFPRIETSVASLDWTKELLTDLVAKRLQYHVNPKPPLQEVWAAYFEQPAAGDIRDHIFDFCQYRPRDVLTYLSHAIENAKGQKHEQIGMTDLEAAKKAYSENRLKDLGNEYSENFPNIHQVLARFHGLARRFTVAAVTDLIKKLLADPVIQKQCQAWMYQFTAPHQFIELLYSLGFVGIGDGKSNTFRGSGVKEAVAPHIDTGKTVVVVHPSYVHALDLQDTLATGLDTTTPLQTEGAIIDLPDDIDPNVYPQKLKELQEQLESLMRGDETADEYQTLVGEIVKYCFFHTLNNPSREKTDVDTRVRRDWIFSNRAGTDFWKMVQDLHAATQIIWECKNYEPISSTDFQQLAYYMNKNLGSFIIISCRGDEWEKKHYFQHIRRISEIHAGGMVLILTDSDLKAFLRQASKGMVKDGLLRDRYDQIKMKIT
jgi:hypothetical protein